MKLRWNRLGRRCMALVLAVMLLAGMMPAAFAAGADANDPDAVKKVTSVGLDSDNLTLTVGEEKDIEAFVIPGDADNKEVYFRISGISGNPIAWASNDPGQGNLKRKIKAISKGTANITVMSAENSKLTATCKVTVNDVEAPSVTVTRIAIREAYNTSVTNNGTVKVRDTLELEAEVTYSDSSQMVTNNGITWTSSNPLIATVNSNGLITGVKEGNAKITASSGNVQSNAFTVQVQKRELAIEKITLDSTAEVAVGSEITLVAQKEPWDAENLPIKWRSDNKAVATVDAASGEVHGIKVGTANITAYSEADSGVYATCRVTVTNPVQSIAFDNPPATLKVGDTVNFALTINPPEATNASIVWSSSNAGVATVKDGAVTGLKAGETTITAAVQGSPTIKDDWKLTVEDVAVSNVILDESSLTLGINETKQLIATVLPENATNKAVTWQSLNKSVADVDNSGKVTGYVAGEAEIQVSSVADGTKLAKCTVTVKSYNVTGVTLDRTTAEIPVNGKVILKATVQPNNASNKEVTWESSDTAVATVKDGEVTGCMKGKATITAKTKDGDKTATCEVTVSTTAVPVSSISLSPSSASLDVGQTVALEPSIDPQNATDQTVTWSSNDESIAKVNGGVVTAVSVGQAVITATTANGKTARCTVNVNMAGSIQFEPQLSLAPGTSKTMSVTLPTGASISKAESENTAVVTVSYSGSNVTVKASGQAKVGAKTKVHVSAGGKTQTCEVTISEFTLSLSSSTLTLNPNQEATLSVNGIPEGAKASAVWKNSAPAYATYSGSGTSRTIKGKAAGSTTITVTPTVNGKQYAAMTCNVTVNRPVAGTMRYRTEENEPVSFIANDFNEICISLTGKALSSVVFEQPSSNQGRLYYDYSDKNSYNQEINPSTKYKSSGSPYIHKVSFVPKNGYNGTATINYTAYSMNSETYTGKIQISVGTGGDDDDYGDLEYSVDRNRTLNLSVNDFNDYCNDETGYNLNYIRFTDLPSSSRGILYYRYSSSNSRVSTGTNYYRSSSPYLDYISFEPASNYSGTVTIPFTGYSTNNNRFTGEVIIHVDDDYRRGGDVTYRTSKNRSVNFNASDFNSYCRDESGNNVNYVRFTSLPSSSRGTLYYKYSNSSSSKVSTSTSYYRSSSAYLDDITFVPANNYTGTVTIPFNAYDTSGRRVSGAVVITVGNDSSSDSGDISYDTAKGRSVNFSVSDFNRFSNDETGYNLNYIRFRSLPSTSRGILYYKYSNSSSTKVSTSTSYYRSSNPYIDDITFVPNDSFTGTVTIPFTAYNTNGKQATGDITIHVGQGSGDDINYSAQAGRTVNFSVNDFNNYSRTVTGYNLDYVRFSLPSTATGTLYYQYSGSSSSRVSASTSYYRNSSPYLDEVSFVPANNSVTSAKISFTGRSTDNTSFSGTVNISYNGTQQNNPISGTAGTIHYASTGVPVAFQTNDFVTVCNNWGQSSLNSVRFSIPDEASGKLYSGYLSPANTGTPVNASINYMVSGSPALSSVAFVPAAGFTGTAVISYVGTDRNNRSFSGSIEVSVSRPAASAVFADVGSSYSWAASSIDYLYKSNVVSGIDASHYAPAQNISRGDFVLMLYRAFDLRTTATSSFYDVPSESYYAQAIAAAKALNIASGTTDGRFNPADSLTRQDAMLLIQRTLNATGKSTPYGATSALGSFGDGGLVAPYAQNAVAALVQSGIVSGNDHGMLNPGGTLSRAEMAIILHRVLTKL